MDPVTIIGAVLRLHVDKNSNKNDDNPGLAIHEAKTWCRREEWELKTTSVFKWKQWLTVDTSGSDGVVDPDVDEEVGRDVGQEGPDEADDHGVYLIDDGARS